MFSKTVITKSTNNSWDKGEVTSSIEQIREKLN